LRLIFKERLLHFLLYKHYSCSWFNCQPLC